jgi:outer membrane protein assembly factor BamB
MFRAFTTLLRTFGGHSLLLLVSSTCVLAADSWLQFRGPDAGVAEGKNLPVKWSAKENVAWSVEVPGRGWSSPIVAKGKIFLTTVERKGGFEEAKKGLYFGGERLKPSEEEQRWLVLCYDFESGKKLWEREVAKQQPKSTAHVKNTYASETQVTDGERIYSYFGNLGLYCHDLDGKLIWSKSFDPMPTMFGWGTASSPILFEDRLIILNDNEKQSYLLCLNKKDGTQIWRTERDEKTTWATPFVWKNEQRTEIVTAGTKRIRSYDLDGKPLWELGGMASLIIPTPFARHGLLYLGSGPILDPRKPIFAVKPGAKGDITLKDNETSNDFVAWSRKDAGPYNPSFLVDGDFLYVLYDRGFIACFEAKTGKPVYEKQRLEGQFTASPWAYDGKVFCLSEDGDTYVIEAGKEFKQLGKNRLEEMCMATPAIVGDSLIVRTIGKLYRIRNAP